MPTLAWIVAAVVLVPILTILGVFLKIALDNRRAAKAAQAWPTTTGTVLSSGIERRHNSHHAGSAAYAYFPAVEYRYEAAGHSHTGRSIHIGQEIASPAEAPAERIAARFPAGAEVTVYYDPDDPAEAVLERAAPGNRSWWLALALVSGGVVVIPVAIMLVLSLTGR